MVSSVDYSWHLEGDPLEKVCVLNSQTSPTPLSKLNFLLGPFSISLGGTVSTVRELILWFQGLKPELRGNNVGINNNFSV